MKTSLLSQFDLWSSPLSHTVLPPLLPTTLPRARLPHSTILMYTSQQHLYHPQLLCFSCKSIYLPYLVNGYIMCIVILNQKQKDFKQQLLEPPFMVGGVQNSARPVNLACKLRV
ncbi:hypothetical protein P8452_16846 [Trifolium repens]|nr:hypothetical protein P8452_16846 [Trifolium repens]